MTKAAAAKAAMTQETQTATAA